MNTHILAAGLAGFLLGGLVVSVAAELDDDGGPAPGVPLHRVVVPAPAGAFANPAAAPD